MLVRSYLFIVSLSISALLAPSAQAADTATSNNSASPESVSLDQTLTAEHRSHVKRQVMSKPGVLLDMANLVDNGYTWANDVVWEGAGLPDNEKWYIAGFYFQRPRYKGVWLQYAFTLDQSGEQIKNLKRWYGAAAFR